MADAVAKDLLQQIVEQQREELDHLRHKINLLQSQLSKLNDSKTSEVKETEGEDRTKIAQVAADADGRSHFETEFVGLVETKGSGLASQLRGASGLVFQKNRAAGSVEEVAPDSREQYIVLLRGSLELELSDGHKRSFFNGDVIHLTNTTGAGHKIRYLTNTSALIVYA